MSKRLPIAFPYPCAHEGGPWESDAPCLHTECSMHLGADRRGLPYLKLDRGCGLRALEDMKCDGQGVAPHREIGAALATSADTAEREVRKAIESVAARVDCTVEEAETNLRRLGTDFLYWLLKARA